jgi:hypothetical protein
MLAVFSLARCECGPEVDAVQAEVEIGDPFQPKFSVCATDWVSDCAYDFGEVAIGTKSTFRFVLRNPTGVELDVESIGFAEGADPAFSIEGEPPLVVPAGAGYGDLVANAPIITVVFAPVAVSQLTTTLLVKSNASNVGAEPVTIRLTATGYDGGGPQITVEPPECLFGQVGVGATAFCDLSISNHGTRDLEIQAVSFTPETDTPTTFGSSTVLPVPSYVAPGTGLSVRLYAKPSSIAVSTGGLVIKSNDFGKPEVTVPLTVEGAETPTAVARVKTVNGRAVTDAAPSVQPLDDVIVTGVDSIAARAGGTIVAYQWDIVSKPPESQATLSNRTAVETGFRFDSANGAYHGLDVAGEFVVRLTVTDDQGGVSSNDARVTLNAVPTEGLHVQLTWDVNENDIDLHMTRGANAGYCAADDCYFGNCKPDAFVGQPPEWDGLPGRSAGDPSLDVDDLQGYGPENINVDSPRDNTYRIGVHFYSGTRATLATVKIYISGALREEYTGQLNRRNDFWEVAKIEWASGAAVVVPQQLNETDWQCGGGGFF